MCIAVGCAFYGKAGTTTVLRYWFKRIEAMNPVVIATSRKFPSACT